MRKQIINEEIRRMQKLAGILKEDVEVVNKIKETDNPQSGKAAPFGSGYAPIKKEGTCGYNKDAETNKMLDTPGGLNEKC